MAQVTKDMCELIISAADRRERWPVTINELRQLAYRAMKDIERCDTTQLSKSLREDGT